MGGRAKVMTIFEQTDRKHTGLIKRKALSRVIEAVVGISSEKIQPLLQQLYPGPEEKVPYAKFVEHLFQVVEQERGDVALTRTPAVLDCPSLPNLESVDLKAVFTCFDLQKTGRLSVHDVATVANTSESNQALVDLSKQVPALAAILDESRCHNSFHTMDLDGNGVVSWFEFVRFFAFSAGPVPLVEATRRGKMLEEDLLAVFTFIDDNRSGLLEEEEVRDASKKLVEDPALKMFCDRVPALKAFLHPDHWERAFRSLDTDRNGSVDWDEYRGFFQAMFSCIP